VKTDMDITVKISIRTCEGEICILEVEKMHLQLYSGDICIVQLYSDVLLHMKTKWACVSFDIFNISNTQLRFIILLHLHRLKVNGPWSLPIMYLASHLKNKLI